MTNPTDRSKEIEIPKDFALLLLNKAFAYSTNRKPELVSHIRQEDFIAGAEWAYRHLHPSPSGWIDANVELPDFGKKVLVWYIPVQPVMQGKIITIDYRREYDHLKGGLRNRLEDNKGFAAGTVTHWQPLPAIPWDK